MSTSDDHDDVDPAAVAADRDAEPITDRVHENSWSANLEQPAHADDPELVIAQAREAIDHTAAGYHVNLVTHGDLGHPESYLYDALGGIDGIDYDYVDQCGCGGHVTRVQVEA
jgi:putative CGCGG family rSAM target protein